MDYVYAIMNDLERKLERPIRDLDDVRTVMETLKKIREQEVDMELKIDPVEVSTHAIWTITIEILKIKTKRGSTSFTSLLYEKQTARFSHT